jgi:hypothetical protein
MFGRKRKAERDAAANKALSEVKFKGSVDDIQSEALPRQGLTKSQKQAATDYMASEKELMPIRRENKMAHFDPDFEDEFVMKGETKKQAPFKGAGGFEYTQNEAGDYEFVGPDGKKGVAKKGTKAYESIFSEMTGGGSLYGTEGYAGSKAAKSSGEAGEDLDVQFDESAQGTSAPMPSAELEIPEKLPVSSKDITEFMRDNAAAMANPMNVMKILSAYDPNVYDVESIKEKFKIVPRVTAEFSNLQKKQEAGTLSREEAGRLQRLTLAFDRGGLRDRTDADRATSANTMKADALYYGLGALKDPVSTYVQGTQDAAKYLYRSGMDALDPLGVLAEAPPIPEEKAPVQMSGAEAQEFMRGLRLNAAKTASPKE